MALPDAPVFLIQQAFQGRGDLAPVGSARVTDGHTAPGLLLDFGAVSLKGVRDHADDHAPLSPLLASGVRYDQKDRKPPFAPWAARKQPGSRPEWEKTVRESLAEQRAKLSPDALVVPGADFSTSAFPGTFENQIDAIRRAWSSRPTDDPDWFAHFCLHDDWLKDLRLRRFALNQMTDLPDPMGIALQVRFSRRDRISDATTLEGLKQIVTVLANDGRRALLVNSGSLGWLSIAWGAWGFTAGRSQKTWVDSRETFGKQKGQKSAPRLERYFEPQLLHHVLFPDHRRLSSAAGFEQCPCSFCKQMTGGWSLGPGAQHDLYALSELTRRVAASDRTARREAVRSIVEKAQTHWASWQTTSGLSPRATPAHLTVWRSLV
jgi:hypothetical protein